MYSSPEKLQDGRYFVKVDPAYYVQLQSVTIGELNQSDTIVHGDMTKIAQVDQKLIDDAVENSKEWFSKEISRDTIAKYYQTSIEDCTVQVIAPKPVFFATNKEITKTPPAPGAICTVMLQLEGLWFLKRSFGPVWKLVQVRERKHVEPIKCMIDDSDEDA